MSISAHAVLDPADLPPYDGSMPIDIWKYIRAREIKMLTAQRTPMLQARDADGKPLYKLTSGGNLIRTKPLSPAKRRRAIERDKACVLCGMGAPFEVDHIVRYIDGGSNELNNLQTLCVPCHKSKGGH